MRLMKPASSLLVEKEDTQHTLPIDRPIVQYIRRSTPGQTKESIQSKIQQDEKTEEKLRRKGFTDIRKIIADDGKSAQKDIYTRLGLADAYKMIRRREVGAIAAYDASRLWRDTTHVWYNEFIQLLIKYHIPFITHARTYWPDSQADMDALREEFAYAAHQLKHFTEKVNPARLQAIELGQNYGGHCVPIGFLVVGAKGEKHYIPYEPHAKRVCYLFKRYRELSGNLSRLARELKDTGFRFPHFDSSINPAPHIGLPHDDKGFLAHSRTALLSILTNPAYIGWYTFSVKEKVGHEIDTLDSDGVPLTVYKREVARTWVNKTAHDAIVPLDNFEYAYTRLSPITLDGEINEYKPKVNRLYGVGTQALLENILESNGVPCYAMAHSQTYTARLQADWLATSELVVPIAALDRAVDHALLALVIAVEQRAKEGIIDSLHKQLTALQEEKQEETESLDSSLANVDKTIAGWELDKMSCREQGNKAGLDEANRELKSLYATRAMLVEKQSQAGKEVAEIAETRSLLDQAVDNWQGMKFENKQRLIRLMVKKVNIQEASPHIIRIDMVLKDPIACTMTGHLYRHDGSKAAWTDEEKAIMHKLYPQADRLAILQVLPNRTWLSIQQKGVLLGIPRTTRLNTSDIDETMSYADVLYMQSHYVRTDSPVFELPSLDMMLALCNAVDAHNGATIPTLRKVGGQC
ncbi:MAG: recombinase family protein [Ktedonobacteraceae bacterium]